MQTSVEIIEEIVTEEVQEILPVEENILEQSQTAKRRGSGSNNMQQVHLFSSQITLTGG